VRNPPVRYETADDEAAAPSLPPLELPDPLVDEEDELALSFEEPDSFEDPSFEDPSFEDPSFEGLAPSLAAVDAPESRCPPRPWLRLSVR
jgi:hypothetical protein